MKTKPFPSESEVDAAFDYASKCDVESSVAIRAYHKIERAEMPKITATGCEGSAKLLKAEKAMNEATRKCRMAFYKAREMQADRDFGLKAEKREVAETFPRVISLLSRIVAALPVNCAADVEMARLIETAKDLLEDYPTSL